MSKTDRISPVIDHHSWIALEFPVLLEKIATLAHSRAGAALVMGLQPSSHLPTVQRRMERLSQLLALLAENPAPAIGGLDEVEPLLERLTVEGAFLLPAELLLVAGFLDSLAETINFLAYDLAGTCKETEDQPYGELARLANQIAPLPRLAQDLRRLVGPGNSVSSQASPELGRIRR